MFLSDRLTIDGSPRRTTDGYLAAVANVARTGIQEYLGSEIGKPEMGVVRVYRPAESVFDDAAMQSMAHRPITINHPSVPVTAENWKQYSVGMVGDEIDGRDGKFIRVPLVLMDASAIREFEGGKRQLSMGYTCDIDWTAGVTADGLNYDAVQRNIRANHLAVVSAARGGPELKIGDSHMTTRAVLVDGISIDLPVKDADILARYMTTTTALADEFKKKSEKSEEDLAEEKKKSMAKDAEIVTLKTQLADATDATKIAARDADRAAVITKAKSILGDKAVTDGRTVDDIRKQVVSARVGDAAKDWTADQVAISFATLASTPVAGIDPLAGPIVTDAAADAEVKAAREAYTKDHLRIN